MGDEWKVENHKFIAVNTHYLSTVIFDRKMKCQSQASTIVAMRVPMSHHRPDVVIAELVIDWTRIHSNKNVNALGGEYVLTRSIIYSCCNKSD